MNCPDCGHENRVGELVCTQCGADLYDTLLEQVKTQKLGTRTDKLLEEGHPSTSRPIVIYITRDDPPISIDRVNGLIIGRIDPDKPDDPENQVDVDLTAYNAAEKGVSRRHLKLNAEKTPPIIEDLDSYNGTFVNGERLVAGVPRDLRSGDEVRLGRLPVRIYFK